MAETRFDEWMAERYQRLWPELFDPAVLDPAVSFLAELAGGGAALEFGVGTGRVALPLSRRGVPVRGIELSPAMAARVRPGPGDPAVPVTVGDMATTRLAARFRLVYLLRNTITNLTSQDEQVAAFRNAAAHLEPDGCFVVENYVPPLRQLPPGRAARVFADSATHKAFEKLDCATQLAVSYHWWAIDGEVRTFSSTHRYAWPAELDLMARLAGMRLRERWAGWHREPFTAGSPSHVSVWQLR